VITKLTDDQHIDYIGELEARLAYVLSDILAFLENQRHQVYRTGLNA
jgi:hypothetical protein